MLGILCQEMRVRIRKNENTVVTTDSSQFPPCVPRQTCMTDRVQQSPPLPSRNRAALWSSAFLNPTMIDHTEVKTGLSARFLSTNCKVSTEIQDVWSANKK
jgi:hypothetical protein